MLFNSSKIFLLSILSANCQLNLSLVGFFMMNILITDEHEHHETPKASDCCWAGQYRNST